MKKTLISLGFEPIGFSDWAWRLVEEERTIEYFKGTVRIAISQRMAEDDVYYIESVSLGELRQIVAGHEEV